MWAQLIAVRLKPNRHGDISKLLDELAAAEQPGSGLLRTTAMFDQGDPNRVVLMVVMESEEKARAREQDPRRQEGLAKAKVIMADIFDGAPEFTDFTIAIDRIS